MRVERPQDRRFERVAGVAAAGAGAELGALASGWPGAGAGLAFGVGGILTIKRIPFLEAG